MEDKELHAIPITDRDVLVIAVAASLGFCLYNPALGIYPFAFSISAFAFHLIVYDKRKKEMKTIREDIEKIKSRLDAIQIGKILK